MLAPDARKTDLPLQKVDFRISENFCLEVFNIMIVQYENCTKSVEAGFHMEGL